MRLIKYTRIILVLILTLSMLSLGAHEKTAAKQEMMVRIAEIEIYPEHIDTYKSILKEEAAASIKKEVGVIAIFPMIERKQPTQIMIVEIYANKEAYEAHLKTPHFLHYKTATQKMVKSLKLVDMEALDKETMTHVFRKLQ